jgi:hypothetical protein
MQANFAGSSDSAPPITDTWQLKPETFCFLRHVVRITTLRAKQGLYLYLLKMHTMKNNQYDYFSEAIDAMVLSEKSMRERVLDAYAEYINKVEIEKIPKNVQYLFHSFQRCMAPKLKTRKFGDPEARQIAKVILFIAEEIKKNQNIDDKNKEA